MNERIAIYETFARARSAVVVASDDLLELIAAARELEELKGNRAASVALERKNQHDQEDRHVEEA